MNHTFQVPEAKHTFPERRLIGSTGWRLPVMQKNEGGEQHAPSSSCHFSHPRTSFVLGAQDCKYYRRVIMWVTRGCCCQLLIILSCTSTAKCSQRWAEADKTSEHCETMKWQYIDFDSINWGITQIFHQTHQEGNLEFSSTILCALGS